MNMTAFIIIMSLATLGFVLSFGVSSLYHHDRYVARHRIQFVFARSALISVITVLAVVAILVEIFS